jgi:hypothetical protein
MAALLQHYEREFLAAGGDIACNAEVVAIKKFTGERLLHSLCILEGPLLVTGRSCHLRKWSSDVVPARAHHPGIPAYAVEIEQVDYSGREPKVIGRSSLQARTIINCAGIGSARVAAMAGIDIDQVPYDMIPSHSVSGFV